MPDAKTMRVLTKDGTSYAHVHGYLGYNERSCKILINGVEVEPAPGDPGWRMIAGEIQSITRVVKQPAKLASWNIREDCKVLGKPESLPADAFERWEDYPAGDNRHFYEPSTEDQPDRHDDVPFEVIDRNSEPVAMPEWVTVGFPASVSKDPVLKHNYPCHVKAERVYVMVDVAVEDHIKGDPNYRSTDYRNIQTATIRRRVEIPASVQKAVWRDYYPTPRSRKTKRKKVTPTERWVDVLSYVGTYKKVGDVIQVETVRGDNFRDLEKNLEEYIQGFLDVLSPDKLCVCETCSGLGVRKSGKK